jgi:micrococcal nuclease
MEETFNDYRKIADSREVFLVGTLQDQITGEKRQGEWPIVALLPQGYLVLDADRMRLVGERGNLAPLRVTLRKGQPITVVSTNVSFSGKLSGLLAHLDPEVEHYISGRIVLARSVSFPSDPEAFATVQGSSELTLNFARWQDLAPLSSEYVTEATLVIVHRLRAGQSLRLGGSAASAEAQNAAPLVPVTLSLQKLSHLVAEEGQWIAEGDPLAQDPERLAQAKLALARAQERHRLGLITDADFEQALAEATAEEEKATVRSPITGVVEQIVVESASPSGITVRLLFRRTDAPPQSSQTTTASEKIDPRFKELPELPKDKGEVVYILRVLDGDTVELLYQGKAEKARLVGVDTPETKDPRKPVQCFGPEASQFTTTTLPRGLEARITWNPVGDKRDKYSRLLVYLWVQLDDDEPFELFNAALVRLGYARVYPFFKFDRLQEFRNFEAEAIAEKAGLWGACNYEPYQK